jgi:hypothetical protein
MRREGYAFEVSTDVPAGTLSDVQLTVMREVTVWCRSHCRDKYLLTTTDVDEEGVNHLAVRFRSETDARRFKVAFG